MRIKFSDKLKAKMAREGLLFLLIDAFHKMNWKISKKRSVKEWLQEQIRLIEHMETPTFEGHPDQKIINIQKWIIKNIRYIPDQKRWKTIEYWQNVQETMTLKTGDCEDGAGLMYALAVKNKVPPYLLSFWCGHARNPRTKQMDGHACMKYKEDSIYLSSLKYYVDWCYAPVTVPFKNRVDETQDPIYASKWFEINHLEI